MPNLTPLTGIPVPIENEDPFFDDFNAMMGDIDSKIYGLLSSAGNIIVPAQNLSFNFGTGVFSWTGDFIMPILKSGYQYKISFGPDQTSRQFQVNDGDKVMIVVPNSSSSNLSGFFKVVPGTFVYAPGLFVFGMRVGNKFYANLPMTF